jgi:hypothetical protein
MLMSHVVHAYVSVNFDQVDFLHVWQNEQNVIYFAYDIHLNPLKLCWVRIDKAYAHVYFEAILRTLIFRPS